METQRIRVLLVDDDEDDYVIIKGHLSEIRGKEFLLDWAFSYESALPAILDNRHDVYLFDYRLGGTQTGLDLLREAVAHDCHGPVILLTGFGDSAVDSQATDSGAADYLIKHKVTPETLERSVRYAMIHKQSENKLRGLVEELRRSNRDLEQFAYVASHDLKEPLSMVVSYLQLLDKRFRSTMDHDAEEFIRFAVDGATRMQALVNDLLEFSRIGKRDKAFVAVDSNTCLKRALKNLRIALQESSGVVTNDPLPTIDCEESQVTQIFQNLIGNAIKFRGDRQPRVHVSARLKGGHWTFSVKDNGIGIEPQYADRIFVIFQRLHDREEYPGTGIGLAICKRIAERHGGRIWVESTPGQGSTFFFTIAAKRPQGGDVESSADAPGSPRAASREVSSPARA
jgi:signal transduction histidine kinase